MNFINVWHESNTISRQLLLKLYLYKRALVTFFYSLFYFHIFRMHSYTASPPSPSQPYVIKKGSTWIQIGWDALDCDGGYQINAYDVQQKRNRYYYSYYSTVACVSKHSFIFRRLTPSTGYYFRVRPVSSISLSTSYSSAILATTHPTGI